MREYFAFARYSGWGKSMQIGAISTMSSNADFNQHFKVYIFKF